MPGLGSFLGTVLDPLDITGYGTDRFDQAGQQGGASNPANYQMPGIGSAGQPGGQYGAPAGGSPPRQGGGGTQGGGGGLGGTAAGGPAWVGEPPPKAPPNPNAWMGIPDEVWEEQWQAAHPATVPGKSGYDQFQDRYTDYLGSVRDRAAPQIGEFQNAQQSAIAGQQQTLADQLAARARGEDSIAELQLRQAADQGMNQQRSMAMGARPGQSAMAARLASQNMQRGQAGLGQQAAIARAQEADMAAGRLGGLLGGMRGADESMSQWNAGQQNSRTGAQAQMNQQQIGMNDAANQGLLGLSQGAADSQLQAQLTAEQIAAQRYGAALGVPTSGERLAGGIEGGVKAAAMSDERAKTGKRDGGAAADAFLGSLRPNTYSMKPGFRLGGEPQGRTLGVMAQDVKSTPFGAEAVGQRADGMNYLDPRRISPALAAGMGRLNERLGAVEARR